jgi:hypothetical protein
MKTDEEIGRAFVEAFYGRENMALWSDQSFTTTGATVRAAVGERPKMMIEGMSAHDICLEMRLEKAEHDRETMSTRFARVAYRLANTPVEQAPDPDALAKEAVDAFRNSGAHDYPNWSAMEEGERDGWRAVAKMMEERK